MQVFVFTDNYLSTYLLASHPTSLAGSQELHQQPAQVSAAVQMQVSSLDTNLDSTANPHHHACSWD